MDIVRVIYDHSPIWWQNVMCTLAGQKRVRQRYDTDFDKRRQFFREAGHWSFQQTKEYQLKKIREIAEHAYNNVPFYNDLFDGAGIKPTEISTFEDWKKIPTITKDDVRSAGESLIASGYRRGQLIKTCTSGTSGIALNCYHSRESMADVYACGWEYSRPGVECEDSQANFTGLDLIPSGQKKGPYWRMNRAMNQRLYSIFHLSDETIAEYIADLDAFKPVYFSGYAHSIYLLAKLVEDNSIKPRWFPRAIFTTSENLPDSYRETIERVFQAKVWDMYSQDEVCGSISEYECNHYHYDHAYGYMEFEDIESEPGCRIAEIVCTGFLNMAWPMIRYKIGDLVEYEPADTCPDCGRAGPIIHKIHGRISDALILPSGRFYPYVGIIVRQFKNLRGIQLVQKAVDKIIVRYVPTKNFHKEVDEKKMLKLLDKSIGESIAWSLEHVDIIDRTRSGKTRIVVNEIENKR